MYSFYESPIGPLKITVSDNLLCSIEFLDKQPAHSSDSENNIIAQTKNELKEYFNGDRTHFSVPLNLQGTDFQHSVWKLLQKIPYGQTVTYGELAQQLGDPDKARAVAGANGLNPIPIIIPCHRVIGADNKLTGYSGGIKRKEFLLQLEGALLL